MTLPGGISTCTVTVGSAYSFTGDEAIITGSVVADRNVVWAATGAPVFGTTVTSDITPSSPGGQASFVVPHVDQDGFLDGAGNDITGWYYTFTGRATFANGQIQAITKRFQPLVGQTTIDLDLVPDGPVIPGVTTPSASVISVNGQTGVVTVDGASDSTIAGYVADPDSDTALALSASFAHIGEDGETLVIGAPGDESPIGGTGIDASSLGPLVSPIIVWEGDSITFGYGAAPSKAYPVQAVAGMADSVVSVNVATSGQQVPQMVSDGPSQVDARFVSGRNNIGSLLGGCNDIAFNSAATAASIYSSIVTWHTSRRSAGGRTIAWTVLPSVGSEAGSGVRTGAQFETMRVVLNDLIRAQFDGAGRGLSGGDFPTSVLADIGADPTIGTTASLSNTNLYVDGRHPAINGYSIMADYARAALTLLGALTDRRDQRYADADAERFYPASLFTPLNGDSKSFMTFDNTTNGPAWVFPRFNTSSALTATGINAHIQVPREWESFTQQFYFGEGSAGGNVALIDGFQIFKIGSSPVGVFPSGAPPLTLPTPTDSFAVKEYRGAPVAYDNTDPTAFSRLFRLVRNPTDSADTLNGVVRFLGMTLRPA